MRLAAVAVCSVLLLGACGGEDEVDPEADRERATAAVLTIDDLPAGFEETEVEEQDSAAADRCLQDSEAELTDADVDEARTAQVTREFEADEGTNVESEVSVFDDDEIPSSLVGLFDDEATLQCLTEVVQEEAEGEGEVSITAVDIGEAPTVPDDLGDQQGAARLELTIEAAGQSFDFTSDLYVVRVDRAVATLTVSQLAGAAAFAEDDAVAAIETMVTRLEDGD